MRIKPSLIVSATVLFASMLSAQNVRSWVAFSGIDTNDCTRPSPCRTFDRAMATTNTGGEVVALESAGYGPMTITKSVTVIAPEGIHAAIAPTTGTAIVVDLANTEDVLLQNLFLNSLGAAVGVHQTNGGQLVIRDLNVNGFFFGVYAQLVDGSGVTIQGSTFRRNIVGTVMELVSGFVSALVDDSLYADNTGGLDIRGEQDGRILVLAREVRAIRNLTGFTAASSSSASVVELNLEKCAVVGKPAAGVSGSTGISASRTSITPDNLALVRVSDSVITANHIAILMAGGSVISRQNNTVEGNDGGETFAATYPAK